jgi:C-terminal processing protease CtpA/Prc
MTATLSSYLLGAEPVQLSSLYWRSGDRTEAFWTHPDVTGTKFGPEKPVYVLNSSRAFSAAEAFGYDVKHLGRATIVGETTRGGAHPGWPRRINSHFRIWIPRGRAINPVTKTNWEGTGVQPDVEVSAERALKTAHVMALERIAEGKPAKEDELQDIIEELEREMEPTQKE